MQLSEYVYNGMIHALLPVAVGGTYWAFSERDPAYHTAQKFQPVLPGDLPERCRFWFHGASVGELTLVERAVDWFVDRGVAPDTILVTSGTASGLERVDHEPALILPADYPALIGPLCERVDADRLFVFETEIWPNLFRYHHGRTVILNGRFSRSGFGGYRRYRSLIRSSLGHCERVLARSDRDARRFDVLAPPGLKVYSTGNLKWCRALDPPSPGSIRAPDFPDAEDVLVAGSTRRGEEEPLLDLVETRNLKLYLAPRHLERVQALGRMLDQRGLTWVSWSDLDPGRNLQEDVVLVDVIGVLEPLYARGDVAYVGGGMDPEWGGHNLLEPAQYGVPVISGPHLSNFRDTANLLQKMDLLTVIESSSSLEEAVESALRKGRDPEGYDRLVDRIQGIWDSYEEHFNEIYTTVTVS